MKQGSVEMIDEAGKRIIVALDTTDLSEIHSIVEELAGQVGMYKIGLEAITAFGAEPLIQAIRETDPEAGIFYDGKFHDIPNTVAGATRALLKYGVQMFNIHASNGPDAIRAAAEASAESEMIFLGVTVLTSHATDECISIFGADKDTVVMQFAKWMCSLGGPRAGIVCSAHEASMIKAEPETASLLTVTPGIRPAFSSPDDQARIMTPAKALEAGANLLVIGRPITSPPKGMSRLEAVGLIRDENAKALAALG